MLLKRKAAFALWMVLRWTEQSAALPRAAVEKTAGVIAMTIMPNMAVTVSISIRVNDLRDKCSMEEARSITVPAAPPHFKEIVSSSGMERGYLLSMLTIALLSTPGARRRIPNPVLDPPSKWIWLDEAGYGEGVFGEASPPPDSEVSPTRVDATPLRPASEKEVLALVTCSTSEQSPTRPKSPWEGPTPPSKRTWMHIESVLPPISGQSPGATPQVLWGCLDSAPFPGESALVSDPSLAARHMTLCRRLFQASGHPESGYIPAPVPVDIPTPPPPGSGVGFFAWTKEPVECSLETGPLGRGWGRTGEEARKSYHLTAGRHDPGMLRISGFSYATTEGAVSLEYDDEKSAIIAGLSLMENARYTANVVVESVTPFKLFTLFRAACSGVALPEWLIFPPGRCWLAGLSRFAPKGEDEPSVWVMRTGVACGEKTCSRMIPEPGCAWMRGEGTPGIAARIMVSAITKSPYFQMGKDRAPDLIERSTTQPVTP